MKTPEDVRDEAAVILVKSPVHGEFEFIVDAADFEALSRYHWYLNKRRDGLYYAYRSITVGGKKAWKMLHREIMQPPEGKLVDHINGNTLDNRRANLRICTKRENNINRHKVKDSSSRYLGVYFSNHTKKWQASIRNQGKYSKIIANTDSELKAGLAYYLEAIKSHGEFFNENHPKALAFVEDFKNEFGRHPMQTALDYAVKHDPRVIALVEALEHYANRMGMGGHAREALKAWRGEK